MNAKKTKTSSPARKKQGRPPTERVPLNADTLRTIYRSGFQSIRDLADELGLPHHTVYAWTAGLAHKQPTTEQRDAVAKVLSDVTGSHIKPSDLARSIDSIRFRFVD
tara:strand:- start:6396 stop:6716 length:321 start_codon:yes stop_codon:yes gene_type:complete